MGLLDALGFKTPQPEAWWELARALRLAPYPPMRPFDEDMCFRRLERARGALDLRSAPSFTHWLCGQHRGVDVAVVQYETGSGSSTITWTSASARVDPPLWLGLNVRRESVLDRIFGGPDIQVGDREADEKLRITSFDPARTAMLLSPMDEDGRRALRYMTTLGDSYAFRIMDSRVEVAQTGVHTDPRVVGPMLEGAAALATWLAARRQRVPPTLGAIADVRVWERFAAANGFQLDPWRMVARGVLSGTTIELGLEVEVERAFLSLIVRFPRLVPVPFQLQRTTLPSFLQGIFSQDIVVGERAFDDAYKVTGADPASVRALLGRPALLAALTRAASLSNDVSVGQLGLDMRIPGSMPSESNLEELTALASTISGELTGKQPGPAPYR